jgi:hypothetical protein
LTKFVKKKNPPEKVAHIRFPAALLKEGPPPFRLLGALLHPGLLGIVVVTLIISVHVEAGGADIG